MTMPLDQLASADFVCALGDEELDRIADLTLRLHQRSARRAGALLPDHMMRTYAERSETERDGLRSAVKHVVCSLVLLDIVHVPH